MKYFLPLFFAALFICILTPYRAQAAIRINEVVWMGTATSQYNEWIELYNDGDSDVPLAGWTIYKTGNVLLFTLTKTITAGGYLLVERTTASAPDAVPGINDESGTFGGGGLKNTGEDLVLKDANGNPVNTLPYASGWPAGDAKTKETMQWTGTAWISAAGTPDAVNASVASSNSGNSSTTQTPAVTVTPIQPVVQNVITPATTVPASTVQSTLPDPDVIAPDQTTSSANTQPVSTPTNVVVPATTIPSFTATPIKNNDTSTPLQNKKTSTSKKTIQQHTTTKSTAGTDTTANDQAAAQLQPATATEPKENNHTKIIIVAVVAFIGMALFLLLERLKASQE